MHFEDANDPEFQIPGYQDPDYYDPEHREQDACGIGFVADLHAMEPIDHDEGRGHRILQLGLQALGCLDHRGACDADGRTSDGCGILTQIPQKLLRRELSLDDRTDLAVGVFFLPPKSRPTYRTAEQLIRDVLEEKGLPLHAWRPVPVNLDVLGRRAKRTRPEVVQVVVGSPAPFTEEDFERYLYRVRRHLQRRAREEHLEITAVSMSCRTLIYKGMTRAGELADFYPDLQNPDFETSAVLFHQRFSTNTRPSWRLAQPFRMIAHNGEINTIQGNRNWMRSREPELRSHIWGEHLEELLPVINDAGSDSAMLDNMLEFLARSGRHPLHALMMLLPEASRQKSDKEPELQAFYEYHNCLVEPWDGPVGLVGCDGLTAFAALDRNGLRPMRYWRTRDGLLVVGSETGVTEIPHEDVVARGRLGPGQMLAVDLAPQSRLGPTVEGAGGLRTDTAIKSALARRRPYRRWVDQQIVKPPQEDSVSPLLEDDELARIQLAFGYSIETLDRIIHPMMDGKLPVASMGNDTPLAVLSRQPQLLYAYFKQRFAQVTNPPIDSLRERLVFNLETLVGGWSNLLDERPEAAHLARFPSPVISTPQLNWLRDQKDPSFTSRTLPVLFPADAPDDLQPAVGALVREALRAVEDGVKVLILSDMGVDEDNAPMPMLLATAAVHQHLVNRQKRMQVSIICDAAEPREDHHIACLIAYGATLVHPYLAYDTVIREAHAAERDPAEALSHFRSALENGLLKVLSRLGVCPVASYHGAQLFEILGLDPEVVEKYFTGSISRVAGVGLRVIAEDMLDFHANAFGETTVEKLPNRGLFRFRKGGEVHDFRPQVFKALHKAVRTESPEAFEAYSELIDGGDPSRLRDLLRYQRAEQPLPLDQVESQNSIIRRFCGAAMSHGALSREVHEAFAIAMNRLGARSNSGEGGEAVQRLRPYGPDNPPPEFHSKWQPQNDDWGNSAIKQVASGRFGVTPAYLRSASELEIKMAQGSKPGEGGQIPGFKVSEEIAELRHSVPGVTLISPPPHHDIYSIEDLAQLIHDLKRVHPTARIGVKLVSQAGVGTVASGVVKAHADYIMISGEDGGTGASPLSSIKHAGMPWELGLAEAQRALVWAGLRERIALRVDGGLKTGRDVVLAALLGAEEFGFGTAPLIALGCVMARVCHLNTCPVGVASQTEKLRGRFPGRPEQAMAFMRFVAEEVRHHLARLGLPKLDDAIGRFDLLIPGEHRAHVRGIDLRKRLLAMPEPRGRREPARQAYMRQRHKTWERNDAPAETVGLDERLYQDASPAIENNGKLTLDYTVCNRDRSLGARLSGEVAAHHGEAGLPEGSIRINLQGTAGQSLGVFLAAGIELNLLGDAQDYVGKGLAGGRLVLRLPPETFNAAENVIAGNVLLYGATRGELFAAGSVGERFCVRNSGATAVVEGCGDHGCEYMTAGTALILGSVGRNFGAGMSGGTAYVAQDAESVRANIDSDWVEADGLNENDKSVVQDLLSRHAEFTGSTTAQELLASWPAKADTFVRVSPVAM